VTNRDIIAVIDDSEIMRDALVHLLCSSGFGVELYASGSEFLAAADDSRAACLLVDIELGDILGTEMVRDLWIRGCSVPVIFMTGSPNDFFRRTATALGCTAFLPKPFPAEEMLQAIDQAIAPKTYRKCG
jgi:FixJ family two-component response regulator